MIAALISFRWQMARNYVRENVPLSRFGVLVAQLESIVASSSQQSPDPLLCFDLLSDLISSIDEEPKESILLWQRKCEDALYSLLILGARRPVRHLASVAMGRIIYKGDNISIYSRVSSLQGFLSDGKRSEPQKVAGAAQCLGELYRHFGRRVTSGLLETTIIATKLMKFHEEFVRQEALLLLQNALEGSGGNAAASAYSEAFRLITRVAIGDKSFVVRIAAARCLKAFAHIGGPGLGVGELANLASHCALEDPVSSVRDAFAEALGLLLALGMNPQAQVQPRGKGPSPPARKLEGGLQRHLALPFTKGVLLFESLRFLTLECVAICLKYMHPDSELQDYVLQVMEMLRFDNSVDAHALACVLYILRVGVTDQMTEPTQRSFLVFLGKQLQSPDITAAMKIAALRILSYTLKTLGEVPSEFKEVFDNTVVAAVSHSSQLVRVEAALTLRALAEVDPTCVGGLISYGVTILNALRDNVSFEKGSNLKVELDLLHGQATVLAALVTNSPKLPLGYPARLPKLVLEVSKKMLTESSKNTMVATVEKEAGWLLLSSLLASMPKEELEDQVFDILSLWATLFSGNAEHVIKQNGDLASGVCVLSAAVDALTSFVRCFISSSAGNNGVLLQPVMVYLSRIEHKVFTLEIDEQSGGREIKITERNRLRSYDMEMGVECSHWLGDAYRFQNNEGTVMKISLNEASRNGKGTQDVKFLSRNFPELGLVDRAKVVGEGLTVGRDDVVVVGLWGALSYISLVASKEIPNIKTAMNIFIIRTLTAYRSLPDPMAYKRDHPQLIQLCTIPYRDASGCEESSCLRLLLDKRDAWLGPWIPGRDWFEDELRAFQGGKDGLMPCVWENDISSFPQNFDFYVASLRLGVGGGIGEFLSGASPGYGIKGIKKATLVVLRVEKSIALAFNHPCNIEDSSGMLSLLGMIEQCLKAGKKQSWHAASVTNICVGLLAGLKALVTLRPQPLGPEIINLAQSIFQSILAEGDICAAQRRASSEGLGLLARLGNDISTARMTRGLLGDLSGVTDSSYAGSIALALGCIHRSAGGMALSSLVPSTVSSISLLAKTSIPGLQIWSLHGLLLTIEAAGLSFVSHVQISWDFRALDPRPEDGEEKSNKIKVDDEGVGDDELVFSEEDGLTWNEVARAAGATLALAMDILLSEENGRVDLQQGVGRLINAIVAVLGPELAPGSIFFSRCKQLVLFAPQAVSVHSHVQTLLSTLSSRQPTLRHLAVTILRHLIEKDPVSVIEERIEDNLFHMLDDETDSEIANLVLSTSSRGNAESNNSDSDPLNSAEGDPRLNFVDDGENMVSSSKGVPVQGYAFEASSIKPNRDNHLRYRTRVFAAECLSHLPTAVGSNPAHFELSLARKRPANGQAPCDWLVVHIQELISLAYQISTIQFENMRPLGVGLLCTIVDKVYSFGEHGMEQTDSFFFNPFGKQLPSIDGKADAKGAENWWYGMDFSIGVKDEEMVFERIGKLCGILVRVDEWTLHCSELSKASLI
ncbi:hypothetical protein JRO89_XS12G0185600 [Xanthoceras sorbifolium]|uniref:HEAT repeat-containing protein 5B n=1 Tax=Xanthoceras sorbifolium TaxID=99658 RepID=A0ABQ8HD09_9ROSI|nr:hypothetical protein JRO89_XS12G0185600 [Xanthoceras sorbifolium]